MAALLSQMASTPKLLHFPVVARPLAWDMRLVYAAVTWAAFAWIALACLPALPGTVGTGLDASWGYALNMAHAQGLQFGRDIVFTYGPLAWLLVPDPEFAGPVPVFLFLTALYGTFLYGAFRCWQRAPDRASALACCAVLCAAYWWGPASEQRAPTAFFALAVAIVADSRIRRIELICAGSFAGLMLLLKPNDGVMACALFGCLLLEKGRASWKWAPVPLAAAAAGMVIANNSPLHLAQYLFRSLQVMAGYSEAMSLPGPSAAVGLGLVALLSLLLFLPLLSDDRRAIQKAFPAVAISGFLFWKHAMVRQDIHSDLLLLNLAVASLFFVVKGGVRDRRLAACFASGCVVINLFGLYDGNHALYEAGWERMSLTEAHPAAGRLITFGSYWNALREQNRNELDSKRLPEEIVQKVGTDFVDAIPHQIDSLRASGLAWRGRPVPQSYAAYSPALDSLNAQHISGPAAAHWAVLDWDAIDGRNPLLDDALSWRALFQHYDLREANGTKWLLERRTAPRFASPSLLSSDVAHWDREMPVPVVGPGEFVIVSAPIQRSWWGFVRGLMFRNDAITLEATYGTGRKVHARVTRANLASGALLSHLPQGQEQVRPYFGEPEPGIPDRIVSIRWKTADESQYAPDFSIAWSRLAPMQPEIREPPKLSLTLLWRAGTPIAGLAGADSLLTGDALAVRPNNLDPQIIFDLKTELRQFQTIVIRARFSTGDRINLFFGKQVDGRSLEGFVPVAGRWLDVCFNVASNRFWQQEAGTVLRFDPTSDRSLGATIEVGGIWGAKEMLPPGTPEIVTYPAK